MLECWVLKAWSSKSFRSCYYFLFSCLIWPLLRADNRNWVSSTANNIHLLWYFGPICFLLAWVVLRSLYQGKYGNNSGWEGVFFLLSRVLDQWLELEMFWFWFWLPEPCSSISEVFSNNIQLLFMSPPPATTHRCPDCAGNLPGDAEGAIIHSLPSNYLHSNFRRLFPPPIYFQTRSKEIWTEHGMDCSSQIPFLSIMDLPCAQIVVLCRMAPKVHVIREFPNK